jgi:hypothetical protein
MALSSAVYAQGADYTQAVQLGKQVYEGNPAALAKLKASANAGSVAAESVLGSLYQAGSSAVTKDSAEAFKWFKKAAEQGDAEAQFGLGVMYANGNGTPQNYAMAVRWFLKSAAQGNTAPNFYLGLLYENGMGVTRNYAEAVKWYAKAAGVPELVGLKFDLATGGGKEIRPPEGNAQVIRDFSMSPDLAQSDAAYNLGMMSLNGHGVPINPVEAYKWFVVADAHGNHMAGYNMRILARSMSQKQIFDALALAASWEAAHPLQGAGKPSSR